MSHPGRPPLGGGPERMAYTRERREPLAVGELVGLRAHEVEALEVHPDPEALDTPRPALAQAA